MTASIRIVRFPLLEPAVVEHIGTDLESMKAAIGGGYLEHAFLPGGLHLWCDEDAVRKGLPVNRLVRALPWRRGGPHDFVLPLGPMIGPLPEEILHGYHAVRGVFFVSRSDEEGAI